MRKLFRLSVFFVAIVMIWPMWSSTKAVSSGLVISEVMYDPTTSEPNGEWVELYNAGSSTINLANYKIGDEETAGGGEGMYQFPSGASIAPGQVIIIANKATDFANNFGFAPDYELINSNGVPNMTSYSSWGGGALHLSNSGDEVLLLDGSNALVDSVSWGSSNWAFSPDTPDVSAGHTLERDPADVDTDSASDWADQSSPNPGQVTVSAPPPTATPLPPTATPVVVNGNLVISEVMYDPTTSEPNGEWVELYNGSSATINLANYKIGDEETAGGGEGMYQFPSGASIAPGQVIIIANKATDFANNFGFAPDYELINSNGVPNMTSYSSWGGGALHLSNSGDEVLLLDGSNAVVDSVSWGNSNWAFSPDAPDVSAGHTLERDPANVDTDSASDWADRPSPNPGQVTTGGPVATATPPVVPTATPSVNPTPDLMGYYDGVQGLSGTALKSTLHNIIDNHTSFPYSSSSTDVWDILKVADADPNNPNNVILFYTGWSRSGPAEYDGGSGWNREHVWAKSHGSFTTSSIPGTDVHMLRPTDVTVNSARGNKDFDNGGSLFVDGDGATGCYTDSDSWEPRDEVKGDVARILFYMAVRYEGDVSGEPDLELADYVPTSGALHGDMSVLLQWHLEDPVDDYERNRNEIIYQDYQGNRNPFIDHPEFAQLIWGN